MRIPRALYDEIVAHAVEGGRDEVCGMIAARDGEAVRVHRATNVARAKPLAYEMDPMEQYKIHQAIEDDGLDLGAIYHSHTRSDPYPSQTDVNLAFYPDSLYVIVGVKDPEQPEVKAYTIVDRRIAEAPLEVV